MEIFFLDNKTSIVGLLACFLFLYFLFSKPKYGKYSIKKLPPEAGGAWPILGHLHLLGGSKLPHITLGNLADKYGPVFNIRLGVHHRTLVVSNWEVAKELFTTHDVAVSSRPKTLAVKHMGYDGVMFGFAPYNAYWREIRKIISMELLSIRRLELLKHVRVSEMEISTKELYKLWNDKKNNGTSQEHVSVEMKQWFNDLNLNVILKMVVGKRFSGTFDGDEKEKIEARRCQELMRKFFYYSGLFLVGDTFPFLKCLDIGGYEKKMKKVAKETDLVVEVWLKEHRLKKESGPQDFMDVMLSLIDGVDLAGYDPDTVIKSTCMSLITGGSDSTTVMLTWALALLLNNRHVMRKAQEEIDTQVGKERRVNESDIANLNYLQAIVKETLRLLPAGRIVGGRFFTQDCIVSGYFVPKGTRLILNLWKLQTDPNIWSDPLEFRPERFLTTHNNIDVKGHQFEFIPFGAGRRICPGTAFGVQMMHFVLANLLHAFDFSTPGNEPIDMTESPGLTNAKATPLEVLIAPRLSPSLY